MIDTAPLEDERYLASLLLPLTARNLRDEALEMVAPEDFSSWIYRALWEGAIALREGSQRIDRASLLVSADNAAGQVIGRHGSGGTERSLKMAIDSLAGLVPRSVEFPAAVSSVTQAGKFRRLMEACDRIKQRASTSDDYTEAMSIAEDEFASLSQRSVQAEAHHFGDLLSELETSLLEPQRHGVEIKTPWEEINDRLSGGLQGGRFYVVGARPGEGKSILAHQMAQFAAAKDHPALVFSIEMGELEVAGRMVADGATIDLGEINRHDLSSTSWTLFNAYKDSARDYPLYVVDRPTLTMNRVRALCQRQKRATGLSLVAVDYLQLITPNRSVSREQQVAEISRGMKVLSRELNVAVVVPAQLNRKSVDRDRPSLADLRESGGIEADADVVMLLSRQRFTEGEMRGSPNGMVTVDIAKNRQGRIGELDLPFRGHYSRIG